MDIKGNNQIKKIILLSAAIALGSAFYALAATKTADKAGSWYPGNSEELRAMIKKCLDKAAAPKITGDIIGIISPHAGYVFSAPCAAYGYKELEDRGIKTAVIVGFNHATRHDGIAVCDYDSYKTPLGEVKIDKTISDELIKQNSKIYAMKEAFNDEQSTELQVPYLQTVLKDFSIVVISIGDQSLANCNILSDALYNVLKTRHNYVLIASTDMSHYLPYDKNNEVDKFSMELIKKFSGSALYFESMKHNHRLMCGFGAVTAVMDACKKLGADEVVILNHINSGDITFDRSNVVGYLSAAFVKGGVQTAEANTAFIKEGEKGMFTEEEKDKMLKLARDTITAYLKDGKKLEVKETDPLLNEEMGAFVTLHKKGNLRGCIGNIIGSGPFYLTVRNMAIESATGDPRFSPVTPDEMKDIDIEISALSPIEKITDPDKIIMGKHGVIVKQGYRSGVYLPQVATETGWSRDEFMDSLCMHKAGISPTAWRTGQCEIYIFTAEVFGETSP